MGINPKQIRAPVLKFKPRDPSAEGIPSTTKRAPLRVGPGVTAQRGPLLAKLPVKQPESVPVLLSGQRYRILSVLNKGGMGTIYRARDSMLKMDVAIKMLKPEIARNTAAMAELAQEAATTMQLSHEHIVRLYNIERDNGRVFIVMEFVEGRTLRELVREMGPLGFAPVLDIAHACTVALTYAHERGVLHRDIKPDNLMVNNEGILKLVDFGTALKLARGADKSEYLEGTPGYMSPEQLHGRPLDARTDVFSLAVVLCEVLTGERTFPNVSDLAHLYDAEPVGLASLPAGPAEVLRRGMAVDVEKRWRTPAEFYAAFAEAVHPLVG